MPLLNKVYFPPACPPIANMFTVLLQAIIEGGDPRRHHDHPRATSGPRSSCSRCCSCSLGLFALGLGLVRWRSTTSICRDVGYLVGIGMNVLFYATPIIYPLTQVPEEKFGIPMRRIIELNPLTQLRGAGRATRSTI